MLDANPDQNQARTKSCVQCKATKDISDFFRHDQINQETASCGSCREARREKDRIARAKDRELRDKAKAAAMSSPLSMKSEASIPAEAVSSSKRRKTALTVSAAYFILRYLAMYANW
jgi:hypothetical protein